MYPRIFSAFSYDSPSMWYRSVNVASGVQVCSLSTYTHRHEPHTERACFALYVVVWHHLGIRPALWHYEHTSHRSRLLPSFSSSSSSASSLQRGAGPFLRQRGLLAPAYSNRNENSQEDDKKKKKNQRKRDEKEEEHSSSSDKKDHQRPVVIIKRVRTVLSQVWMMGLMLLAQFRPLPLSSPGLSSSFLTFGGPQGIYFKNLIIK